MTITAEQLADRKVGGSMVGTILGLNPWETPEELRLSILGRVPPRVTGDEEPIIAGTVFEDGIRQFYAKRTGRVVHQVHRTVTSEKYPWLTAHLDGEVKVERPRRGVELKNVGYGAARFWGNPADGPEGVPTYYLPQPITYQIVTGWDVWDVAAYFGGADLRIFEIPRDAEFEELIVEATHDFWHRHVLQDVEIEIDCTRKNAIEAIKRIYRIVSDDAITFSESIVHWHAVRLDALAKARNYTDVAETAKAHILATMGNAGIGVLPDGTRYERRLTKRAGYTVEPTEYIELRHVKPRNAKGQSDE